MKTYTGGLGYVYQYYFVGKRGVAAASGKGSSTEYVFDVTSDRKTTFAVSVFLPDEVLRAWSTDHGRALTEAEQYGAVKMRLFQGFDEIENMQAQGRQLSLDSKALQELLLTLGVS